MAQTRLRVRRLSDEEGRQLQRIVRRGGGDKSIVKWRRSMVVLASAGGNSVGRSPGSCRPRPIASAR